MAATRGKLVVISAPSGAGKSTLCRGLHARHKNLVCSISVTTRQPRPGERDGKDYYFVSEAAFLHMKRNRQLVEWAKVHGHYYGTPKHFIEKALSQGRDILLNIDVQGGFSVRRIFPKDSVLIFITTKRISDLAKRLRLRSADSPGVIRERLANARKELACIPRYDYVVVNEKVPVALAQLDAILTAESLRSVRYKQPRR